LDAYCKERYGAPSGAKGAALPRRDVLAAIAALEA